MHTSGPHSSRQQNADALLPDPSLPLPASKHVPVTRQFLDQAARRPDAPALRESDRVRSYAELERAAGRIAAELRSCDLPDAAAVAVEGSRGFFSVASLLGAMLAGNPVLLLDPTLPPKRREHMLRASEAALLVTDCGDGVAPSPCPTLFPDLDRPARVAEAARAESDDPSADAAAYLFFTSGTSGVARGVLGSHGALAHFVDWQREAFGISEQDRIAHVTGLSFDVVLREIFLALCSGACLCVPDEAQRLDPGRLIEWLKGEQISRLHAVPTVAGAWLGEAAPDTKLPHLRSVFFAGEPLTRSLVDRWRRTFGSPRDLINLYGPTETTLAKCWQRVPESGADAVLGVGRALPESQLLVLTPERRRCEFGEAGEVWIRTPWRSLGYVNAPSPFVANPFRDDPADLVYPTGDRGRIEHDGGLSLLGRLDDQCKIRGVRVEPGEVSAALEAHSEIRAACVLAHAAETGNRLVAYFAAEAAIASQALREFLGDALPDAMVPSEFVQIDELPRTANGKVDREALRSLRAPTPTSRVFVSPRGATAHTIAAIWEELLGVEDVGANDDFFDLGGDSLRALSCVTRLRDRSGAVVSVVDLFSHRTVAELALHIDDAGGGPVAATGPLQRVDRSDDLPLSFAQERIWFQCQLEGPESTAYNIPVTLSIRGALDRALIERCLREIVRRHESLRSHFPIRDGAPVQRVAKDASVPLEIVDLRDVDSSEQALEIRRCCMQQSSEPFDLAHPADNVLLRAMLFVRAPDQHDLHLTVHHLAFDGWSRWLLIGEIAALYQAFARRRPSPLRQPPIQYGDFAAWIRANPPGDSALAHWRERLAGAPTLEMPCDRPRPAIQDFASATVHRTLSGDLSDDLRALARAEGATLFMVLLTGFQGLLAHWTGQSDVTVGTPVANRTRPELEELLGCFIDTLPLRTKLAGEPSFRDALRRVREVVLDAFEHSELRFEKLVQELRPKRDPSRHPIFDVMFNLVNVPRALPESNALEFSFPEIVPPESHFAFTLYAREWAGEIELRVVYQTALFDADRMERLLAELEGLLRGGVANAELRLSELATGAPPTRPVAPTRSRGAAPTPAPFTPPRTPTESSIAAIWCALLECRRPSVHDNFFDLGGHSLLATRVLYRIRRDQRVDIPLRALFENQTIAELASVVESAAAGQSTRTQPAKPRADAGALSRAQRRLWEFACRHPESAHYNVPRAARFRGPLDPKRLEWSFYAVVERHPGLLSRFELEAEQPVSRVRGAHDVQFAFVDGRSIGYERSLDAEIETPFDLSKDPLLRATLVAVADDDHVLLVTAHHIVADCWSLGMPFGDTGTAGSRWMAGNFFRELWSGYHELGREPGFAPAAAEWRTSDAIAQQNAWLESDEARKQLDYWLALLDGSSGPLEVPPDFERPAVWDFRGARPRLSIDRDLTARLRALARSHEATLFAVLLAGFDALLLHWTGEEDVLVGTTAANRARWDADELIGFFSNNLLLRTDLGGDPSFAELIDRTRETAFAAWSNQELPFECISEALGADGDPSRHPLFQTRIILHQPDDESFDEAGLTLTPMTTGREVAKYDLTLLLADDGQQLNGWLEYATSLYRPETVDGMCSALLAFLREGVTNPDRRLSELWHAVELEKSA